jgi:hypothetical protein
MTGRAYSGSPAQARSAAAALKPALEDLFSAGCVDKAGFSLAEAASDEAAPR